MNMKTIVGSFRVNKKILRDRKGRTARCISVASAVRVGGGGAPVLVLTGGDTHVLAGHDLLQD